MVKKGRAKSKSHPRQPEHKYPDYGKGLNMVRLFATDKDANAMYGYVNVNGIEYTLEATYRGVSSTTKKFWWGGKLNLKHKKTN